MSAYNDENARPMQILVNLQMTTGNEEVQVDIPANTHDSMIEQVAVEQATEDLDDEREPDFIEARFVRIVDAGDHDRFSDDKSEDESKDDEPEDDEPEDDEDDE